MNKDVERAVEVLRAGGLVAFPTETVYGLGADAAHPEAVRKIFAAKGRPAEHPLIVHLGSAGQLPDWAVEVPESAHRLAQAFWPGPLTLILRRAPHVPLTVTGGQDTVGLRMPGHPLALELLRAFGGGVAAPSANRFGRVSPTTAEHVRAELGDRVDLILDGGPCEVGLESTILDLSRGEPRLLRPGGIPVAALEGVLGLTLRTGGERTPRVSGSLDSHYAPSTPTRLVAPAGLQAYLASRPPGRLGVLARRAAPAGSHARVWKELPTDAARYARALYAGLRELDDSGCDEIVVEAVPESPEWLAVTDRLRRAATK